MKGATSRIVSRRVPRGNVVGESAVVPRCLQAEPFQLRGRRICGGLILFPMKTCWLVLSMLLVAGPPAWAQDTFAPANGARLFYQDEGTGHALVLIHGWPMSARMWDDQVAALKQRYRVI